MENQRLISEPVLYYFKLQYKRFSRKCEELQVLPFMVFMITILIFTILSMLLFNRTSIAQWLYPGIGLALIAQLNNGKNSVQLTSIFTFRDFRQIKLIQGLIIALPFLLFLGYKQLWLQTGLLIILGILASQIKIKPSSGFRIPTPFKKWPFEFIVGFRKSIILVALLYLLVLIGIQVGNANLGYACMGFLFLLSMSFYTMSEDEIFVWISNQCPKQFLKNKLTTALLCSSILSMPALLALLIVFPNFYMAAIFIFLAGYICLITMVLAKYAAFPKELSLPQAIIFGISLMFPPLLIYTIPSFYRKACRQVQNLLEC